ncbi:MAG: 16S rRNA (uracil(1498)-N(3))-methyltransferase [Candidatus Hydrogenedentes bacterium]|nr:16S rRNA (uracil(1498)-N(3))-methyltransferase [Candidatus Hydrogenedentota bacterium]
MKRSLRLRSGDSVTVADGSDRVYEVELTSVSSSFAEGQIVTQLHETGVMPDVWLVQGLPKGRQKADGIVRQTTEVGVGGIVFARTDRSNASLPADRTAERIERWTRVAREAASQSRRIRVPSIHYHETLTSAVECLPPGCFMLVAREDESKTGLRESIKGIGAETRNVAVFVGPEGGFSEEEHAFLDSMNAHAFHMGATILRTETAAVVATALVRHELGLM